MIRHFFAAMLMLLPFVVCAQKFRGGVAAGVTTTQIDGDGYMGFNKAGLTGGGFVNSRINKNWLWQFELMYAAKGSVKPSRPAKGDYTYRSIELRYIELPLLIKYTLPLSFKDSSRAYHFTLIPFAGLSYGRLFYTREADENGEIPLIGPFHKSEIAFHGGLNYYISRRISMDVRYTRSLWPVADKFILTRWGLFGGSFNTVLAFTLRYQFIKNPVN